MKIQILKENLAQAVSLVGRFTSSQEQSSVFEQILIEATSDGVFFTATSMDMGIRLRVGGKIVEEGEVLVGGKIFQELVSHLPLETVELSLSDEGLVVEAGRYRGVLEVMVGEAFPRIELGSKDGLGSVAVSALSRVVKRVGFAVSQDDTRPVLTGIHWNLTAGSFEGTDGYRLSLVKDSVSLERSGELTEVLVGGAMFSEVVRVAEELSLEEVEFSYLQEQRQLAVEGDDVVVVGRVLQGEYPQVRSIIPKQVTTSFTVDRKQLLDAVRAVVVFARDSAHVVRFLVSPDGLEVVARAPRLGEQRVEVEVEFEKDGELEITFNGRYLLDFLSHVEADEVECGMTEALKPAIFREKGFEGYDHVIMPVRTG